MALPTSASGQRPELIEADLRARLRPVCDHLDEADFEALVQRILETKLRWSHPGTRG